MEFDWTAALDEIATDLLQLADCYDPPVDAFHLADRLDVIVAIDQSLPVRGSHKTLRGRTTIFLRHDPRPERLQWALAHELGEALAWKVAELLGAGELPPGQREDIANHLATRLLLPAPAFFATARRCGFDLHDLKRRYDTASHALIAMRLLDAEEPAIVTIIDHGQTTCRKSNLLNFPRQLLPEERRVADKSHQTSDPASASGEGFQSTAWPVHEPQWKREIVHTRLVAVGGEFQ